MIRRRRASVLLLLALAPPAVQAATPLTADERLDVVRGIVAAVNAGDADAYVRRFAPDVQIHMLHGALRIDGRDALRENRARHFQRYPNVRNELVHLVAIDQRVVMHDRVKLYSDQERWADIVEVFTFEQGEIVRVDVVQPDDLFVRQADDDGA